MAKSKNKRTRTVSVRQDYRKGGKVQYAIGGAVPKGAKVGRPDIGAVTPTPAPTPAPPSEKVGTPVPDATPAPAPIQVPVPTLAPQPAPPLPPVGDGQITQPRPTPAPEPEPEPTPAPTAPIDTGRQGYDDEYEPDPDPYIGGIGGGIFTPPGSGVTPTTPIEGTQDQFETERRQRVIDTGQQVTDIAAGELPTGLVPEQELKPIETGEQYEGQYEDLAQRKGVTPEFIKKVGPELVAQMQDTQTAATPEQLKAVEFQAFKLQKEAEVEAATGTVSKEVAEADVERVTPIEGAKVEIKEGALAERVIGSISPEAKAQAAINAGTSLARVTRAKKQLRTAGLSEEDITELGNDPESLEARLTDFTEAQRGIIEGLPEEALVSNQLDSLLSGLEEGEIPMWARPAVANVEKILAERGMSVSTVGRDTLINTIIQSSIPLAQANAQAIQQSVAQQKTIEAQVAEANAQRRQQTALSNANNVFQMDMAQFSADQQTALSNSKFLQTVSLTEASNEQQATIQNAVLMSQANLAEASLNQQAQIKNADSFLKMDLANLSTEQQSNVVRSQLDQQRLLSDQAAENAARQFRAVSANQTQQFMTSLNNNIEQFNAQQMNAAEQFNVQQSNAAEARRVGIEAEINKADAAIVNQAQQFNEQIDFNREQFNTQNAVMIEQSNIEWRRKANLADTAAQNAINQQNVQMAYGLSSQALSFLWQELRDQADYDFRWADNTATRKVQAMVAAAGAEGDAAKNWNTNFNNVSSTIDRFFGTS